MATIEATCTSLTPLKPQPKKRSSVQQEKRPRIQKTAQKSRPRPSVKTAAEASGRQPKPAVAPAQTVQALEARLREERRYFSELLSKKDREIGELEKRVKELQNPKH